MFVDEGACEVGRAVSVTPGFLRTIFYLAVVCSVGTIGWPAIAAEPNWPTGTYKYITVNQSVGDALVEFGKNIGVTVRGSKEVKGRLSAGMPVGTAREFLEWVCNKYGLVWHFDGSVINVASQAEMQTEMIKVDANTASSAAERLATLGVSDLRFPVKVFEKDDVVSVSGPPSYVALVKKTLGVTTGASPDKDGAVPVRVFRGRSAETRNFPAEKPQ